MDQQTPGTQSDTGSAPQQAYTPAHHHTPVPASGQPDTVKRAIALVIDSAIIGVAYFVVAVVGGIVAVGSGFLGALIVSAGAAAATAGILLRDVALQGRSPGKKIMGLGVATASGGAITPAESVKRNATLAVGMAGGIVGFIPILGALIGLVASLAGLALFVYEAYLVFTHQTRLGDKIAGTHVVAEGTPAIAI